MWLFHLPNRRRDGPFHRHELPLPGGGRDVDAEVRRGEDPTGGPRRRSQTPPEAKQGY